MKKIYLSLFLVLSSFVVSGQQLPLNTQFLENAFLLNPAFSGDDARAEITASARLQWTKIKDAPLTQAVNYKTPLEDKNIGIGISIINDMTGPTSLTGIYGGLAYKIRFKKHDAYRHSQFFNANTLSIGVSAAIVHYRLKSEELILEDPDDRAIVDRNDAVFMPDAGVGAIFFHKHFFVGFSVPQVLSLNLHYREFDHRTVITRVSHYYAVTGAKIPLAKDKVIIEPLIWVKKAKAAPFNADFDVRVSINNMGWIGAGYRSSKDIIIGGGLNIEFLKIGYSYDISVSKLRNHLGSTHEFTIGYRFKQLHEKSLKYKRRR